jgi:hypothetical protein
VRVMAGNFRRHDVFLQEDVQNPTLQGQDGRSLRFLPGRFIKFSVIRCRK